MQFKFFLKNNIKIIKIHPRFLNLDLKKNFKFFKKIFLLCEKNKINIMFCSFQSYHSRVIDYNFLDLFCKLTNLTKNIKVILMHAGGTNMLRFYERLRFKKNIIFDLSYTSQHFLESTLYKDIIFLINNFDQKIIFGSDYPSKKIILTNKFLQRVKKHLSKKKYENIIFKNLEKIINEAYKYNKQSL